ncbi:unnamed protein product [Brassica napus]|uniref:(rape) hypothetical protein n=1 Tax=Brassica napus TaxID=3708 RepID=A0A816UAX3_BRANA|nr:unnamed protein product [Brassica napus]
MEAWLYSLCMCCFGCREIDECVMVKLLLNCCMYIVSSNFALGHLVALTERSV